MRLFIGLPVPDALAQGLVRTARALNLPSARWTPPENLHLTLFFLGQVSEDKLPMILGELDQVNFAPLELRFTQLGCFPRAGILFADLEATPRLLRLQAHVALGMVKCGFASEGRPYHPHVTLARMRSPIRLDRRLIALPSQLQQRFTVAAVNLYGSRTLSTGAQYEIIAAKRAA
jgi:RNA 2',3'-cyclic 3'-phosphodiesterase